MSTRIPALTYQIFLPPLLSYCRQLLRTNRPRRLGRFQVIQNLARALVTLSGLGFQAAQDDLHQIIGQVRVKLPGIFGLFVDSQIHGLQSGFRFERYLSRHHLVEDQTQGVEVAAVVHGTRQRLFRRHVAGRAQKLAAQGHLGGIRLQRLGQAKVGNVNLPGLVEQNVLRLQVAVNHAFGVRGFQGGAQLLGDGHRPAYRQASLAPQQLVQIFALHVGHGDELGSIGLAQVVNAQNVLVGYLAGQQQFLAKALADAGIGA